jgi:hypothetical protein
VPTTVYRLADGTVVPSVTTVLDAVLAKPALVGWANREGLAGRRIGETLERAASIGTRIHADCMALLAGWRPEVLEPPHRTFLDWVEARHVGAPLLLEHHLVSEEHRIGGTPDAVLPVDGVTTLVDIKTGSGIYREHAYQCGTYLRLLQYAGWAVERAMILRVPRDGGAWEEREVRDPDTCFRVMLRCRELYDLLSVEVI